MTLDQDMQNIADVEALRDEAIEATKDEAKTGGSRTKCLAFSNLAIVYQLQLMDMNAAWRERFRNI